MKPNLYSYDYSRYKRWKDEDFFCSTLDTIELQKAIKQPLSIFVEGLYNLLIKKETIVNIDLSIIQNEELINSKIQEKLTENKHYKTIKNYTASKNLFTNAYNKFYKRLFEKDGLNDEKYEIQCYVHSWLEKNLAAMIVKDKRFSTLEVIISLLEQTEMCHFFYTAFQNNISKQWITSNSDEWIRCSNDTATILDYVKTFDRDFLIGYENQMKSWTTLSPYKFIVESTHGADYAMLNTEYSFRNETLFSKDKSLWIKFLDNLKFPILQNIVFQYLCPPIEYIQISKTLKTHEKEIVSSPKHLAIITLRNLFDSICKAQENLSLYDNQTKLEQFHKNEWNDKIIDEGKEIIKKWVKQKFFIYHNIFEELNKILTYDEIAEWVFSFKPRIANNEYSIRYNGEIEILVTSFNESFVKLSYQDRMNSLLTNFNLPSFNAFMKQVKKINQEQANEILDNLVKYISSDVFYWDGSFSEMYFSTMKNIGLLLSLSVSPLEQAYSIIEKFRASNEGWNVSKIDYKVYQKEAFMLCGVSFVNRNQKYSENGNGSTVKMGTILQ